MTRQTAGLAGRFNNGRIAVIGKKTSGKFDGWSLFLYRRDKNNIYFYLEYRMTTIKK